MASADRAEAVVLAVVEMVVVAARVAVVAEAAATAADRGTCGPRRA